MSGPWPTTVRHMRRCGRWSRPAMAVVSEGRAAKRAVAVRRHLPRFSSMPKRKYRLGLIACLVGAGLPVARAQPPCDRECLKRFTTQYLVDALRIHLRMGGAEQLEDRSPD